MYYKFPTYMTLSEWITPLTEKKDNNKTKP